MSASLLRRPEVEKRTGYKRASIYALMDPASKQFDPFFPKPVKTGKRAVAWIESEINAWIEFRIQKSRGAA